MKPDVLFLACPDTYHEFSNVFCVPNLGLPSIAGNIKDLCNVMIADLILSHGKISDTIKELIKKYSPNLVGISCMTFQYGTAIKIARLIKEIDRDIEIVFGGYHPSLCFNEISQSKDSEVIDYLVRGEGELIFRDLVKGVPKSKISGLSYKTGKEIKHNKARPPIKDINILEMPLREARIFNKGFHVMGFPADTIESSRGCVFNCKFCSIKKFYGTGFRTYSIERVINDIENVRRMNKKLKTLFFVDDNMTIDMERIGNLCRAIISNGLDDLDYIVQASVRGIASRPDVVNLMAKAGFKMIFLGMENRIEKNLSFMKKAVTLDETNRAVKSLKENKIITIGGFVVGQPTDTEGDIASNLQFAKDLKIDLLAPQILTPYPKTEIREDLDKMGLITNKDDFSLYNGAFANVKTNTLSSQELQLIYFKMIYKFYIDVIYHVKNNLVLRSKYGFPMVYGFGKAILKNLLLAQFRRKKYWEIVKKNGVNF